jgi:hypothetical protein
MSINKYIEKVNTFVKKNKFWLFFFWQLIVLFLALDGISRNLHQLDINFFFKGLYNNRIALFLPIWLFLFLKVTGKKDSRVRKFLNNYSLFLFVIVLNIYNLSEALPYEDWFIYLVRFIISFFVVLVVMPFIRRLIDKVDKQESFEFSGGIDTNIFFSKKEVIGLLMIVILFVLFRFASIDGLYPTTDEYLHLGEAKKIISPETILYNNGNYTRASFLTNILEFLFLNIGMSITVGRLPGIVISCITVIAFYVVLRKENKTLAFLSSMLYALSPWSIMLSRTVREYIYFLPIFLILGVYLYKRIKKILDRKYKFIDGILDVVVFGLTSYYSFFIDPLSTVKFFVVIYLAAIIYLLVKIIEKKNVISQIVESKKYRNIIYVFWGIFTFLLFANKFLGLEFAISQIDIIPSLDLSWIKYIFLNGEYGSLLMGGVFLIAGIIGFLIEYKKEKNKVSFISYVVTVFIIIMYFFTFHFGRYYRPRYISILLPFLICLQAYGFTVLSQFLLKEFPFTKGKNSLLLLIVLNWVYIFYSFLITGAGYVKVTKEFHEGVELVYEEIREHDKGFVLVTTLPDAADWYWDEDLKEIYHIAYSNDEKEVELDQIVNENNKGYLVMDTRRNTWGGDIFKFEQNYRTISGKKLRFYSSVDVYLIYRWEY